MRAGEGGKRDKLRDLLFVHHHQEYYGLSWGGIMNHKCCLHRFAHVYPLTYLHRPSPEKALSGDGAERKLFWKVRQLNPWSALKAEVSRAPRLIVDRISLKTHYVRSQLMQLHFI